MKRLFAMVCAASLAFAAYGHTKIAATSPAADASVAAPRVLELEFAGDVRLTSVTLTDSKGAQFHLDAVPTEVASTFELAIHETLAPGDYIVVWRAVGGDTHIVSGEFAFKVVAAPSG
jgi:methionine-rich copper-binding protein CopC